MCKNCPKDPVGEHEHTHPFTDADLSHIPNEGPAFADYIEDRTTRAAEAMEPAPSGHHEG